jgi:hypothetical protein
MRRSRRDLWRDVHTIGGDGDRDGDGLRQTIPWDLAAEWRERPESGSLEWLNDLE